MYKYFVHNTQAEHYLALFISGKTCSRGRSLRSSSRIPPVVLCLLFHLLIVAFPHAQLALIRNLEHDVVSYPPTLAIAGASDAC